MKIDLIIPVYRLKGLRESLMSINRTEFINAVIVDDGQYNNYSEIISEFGEFFDIQLVQLDKNVGQGLARQAGVDASNNELIMFLDCGDLLYSPKVIDDIIETFQRPEVSNIEFLHTEKKENKYTIGRIAANGMAYRRSFIEENNISFCPTDIGSRKYEDVGWKCQVGFALTISSYWKNINSDEYSVIKVFDDTSISNKNNGEYGYYDRAEGIYENISYAIDKFSSKLKNNEILYRQIIYDYFMALFLIYKENKKHDEKIARESYAFYKKWFLKYIKEKPIVNKVFIEKIFIDRFHMEHLQEEDYEELFNAFNDSYQELLKLS